MVYGHEKINEREHQPVEDRLQCQQKEGIGGKFILRQVPVEGWLEERISQDNENIGSKKTERHKGKEEEKIA